MTGKAQVLTVAPKDFGFGLHGISGEDVVKVDNLVPGPVSDQNKHRSLMGLNVVLY